MRRPPPRGARGARQLYPEWPLAATRGVGRDLVVEVAAALMRINASHPAVPARTPCSPAGPSHALPRSLARTTYLPFMSDRGGGDTPSGR